MCSTALASTLYSSHPPLPPATCRQGYLLPPSSTHSQQPSSRLSGIRTPPTDDMSTAYHASQLSSYDNHVVPAYSSGLGPTGRPTAASSEAVEHSQHSRYPTSNVYLSTSSQSLLRNDVSSALGQQRGPASRHSTRPSTPMSGGTAMGSQHTDNTSRRGSQAVTGSSLQIPSTISPNGGSISDFAAQVCTFKISPW
jgi:hypothetical protein